MGYTGFVGSNLINQVKFDDKYSSKNISSIKFKSFYKLYCSGVPSLKWYANKNPVKDLNNIKDLIRHLDTITVDKLILISTIGIYGKMIDVDENTKIINSDLDYYGKNRLLFENYIKDKFDHLIIRLPGLFGSNLKKNWIFDIMKNDFRYLPNINSQVQLYNLDYLNYDIDKALKFNIKKLNISTEPIPIYQILKKIKAFKKELFPKNSLVTNTNMKSIYSEKWGHSKPYLYSKEEVLNDFFKFISIKKN